jgi:hypothetical protein
MTQEHKVETIHSHHMYAINGSCECGWSKEYVVCGSFDSCEDAAKYLQIKHDEFVAAEEADEIEYTWTRQKDHRGDLSYTSECGVINRVYETHTTRSIRSRTTYYSFVYEGTTFNTLSDAKYFAENYYTAKVSA